MGKVSNHSIIVKNNVTGIFSVNINFRGWPWKNR